MILYIVRLYLNNITWHCGLIPKGQKYIFFIRQKLSFLCIEWNLNFFFGDNQKKLEVDYKW